MLTILPIRYVADVQATQRFYAPGTVELGFATDERVEDLAARLTADGYEPEIVEENFGRSIRVTDPDGVVAQIQEIVLATARRSQEQMRP